MTKVQSPVIGDALRVALDLQGAGGMPLEAESIVLPVAIVADVRDYIPVKSVPAWSYANSAPVAAQFSYTFLSVIANAPQIGFKRLLLNAINLRVSIATSVVMGVVNRSLAGSIGPLARRKDAQLVEPSLGAQSYFGASATAVSANFPEAAQQVWCPATPSLRIEFPTPIVLTLAPEAFFICVETVNTGLNASFEWLEVRE